MTATCFRCDWVGETGRAACPSCGAPLYRPAPRDPERRTEETRRRTGVPYSAVEVAALQQEAAKAGVAPLAVSEIPLGS